MNSRVQSVVVILAIGLVLWAVPDGAGAQDPSVQDPSVQDPSAQGPSAQDSDAQDPVHFSRQIRPILSEYCLACHGFDEESREAGLRLDTFEDATEYGAIVPGEADESELIRRVLSDDPDEVMPPPETEKTISESEIQLLKRWIDEGATYNQHWAWRPLRRPEIPGVSPPAEGRSRVLDGARVVDTLLQQQWEKREIGPVERATPRERLRRLSFDLRGLPPTADDVAAFEASPTDKAFNAFRDRWMADLSYAEHQATRWLDLVRWADTSGFVSDEPIDSGAYRAWVIKSIADNMPFDQFSTAQLAGDLLDDPTDEQLIASGYNRIVNTNCEAGAIEQEQLYKLKGEHVRSLGTVWLGMTTGCAECHDHKFDPLTAKDYYSLAAFFDDLVEAGVYTPGDRREPLHYVHDDPSASERDLELTRAIETISETLASLPAEAQADWETVAAKRLRDTKTRTDFNWVPARLPAARIFEGEFTSQTIAGRLARRTRAAQGELNRHHAAEFISGYLNPAGVKTDESRDAWFVDVWIDEQKRPEMVGFQISNGKYGRLGWQTENYETYYWGEDTSGQLSKAQSWSDPDRVRRLGDLPEQSGWIRLRVPFAETIPPVGGKTFERCGMAWLHAGGTVAWGDSGLELRTDKATELELGETAVRRWWETPKNRQVYERRTAIVAKALKSDPSDRDPLQQTLVTSAFREQTQPDLMEQLRQFESELYLLRSQAFPVLVSKRAEQRKTTRLLHRGDYQDESGPIVSPDIPEFLDSSADGSGEPTLTRLDLARWLFSSDNPLVARVYVNRLWHQFFGRGISETLEDSGTQGDWPSHPALLDWLAAEFRESGWDRNHMVRILTSTEAYHLSSEPSAKLLEIDPENRLHARQSRFRLPAESIRDTALHAAGLLESTTEIPLHSFFPYQPDPYWTRSDKIMYGSRHMVWETSGGRNQYRRSLYTFWKRQNIHPTLLAFDAPTRQECTAKRNITNTPGQALALLNDPIFVEAARVLAMRVCDSDAGNDSRRIEMIYSRTLQRRPDETEIRILKSLLDRQRVRYANDHQAALQLVSIGQTPAPDGDRAPEIAAWTAVTRAMLNLHEFLNRF